MENWARLFEASLEELLDWRGLLLQQVAPQDQLALAFYLEVMIAYYQQDLPLLQTRLDNFSARNDLELAIGEVASLRLNIRRNQINEETCSQWSHRFEGLATNELLLGEGLFVLATAHQQLKNFAKAKETYLKAAHQLEVGGARKKALRALLSSAAAHSCENPSARLFVEYNRIFKQAMAISEHQTAAACLLNISREYHLLNSHLVALDYAEQAVSLYERSNFGCREHGLALLHQAHVLFDLNRAVEARKSLEEALIIPHPEVQSACASLGRMRGVVVHTLTSSLQLATWAERERGETSSMTIGEIESRLICLLASGPLEKSALIESLYGTKVDYESIENRFKNTLSRVRAKFPGLIVFSKGHYVLSEPSEFPEVLRLLEGSNEKVG